MCKRRGPILSDMVSLFVWKNMIYSSWTDDASMFGSCLIPLVCKWGKWG